MKSRIMLFSLLFALGCNNSQVNTKNEQNIVDSLSVENEYEPNRQSIDLFILDSRDSSSVAFTSLSDIYLFSGEDSDTLVLPNIEKKGIDSAQYFVLDAKYRNKFLSKTKISETDSVFIYDYARNKLVAFLVKNLKVAAMLSYYTTTSDWPYSPYDYMIGFEIDKKKLKGFSDYYMDALVYVGKENPFAQKQLTPITWKKIAAKDFPSKTLKTEDMAYLQDSAKGNTYLYETSKLQYFLQEYLDNYKEVENRHLLVVESETKNVVIEKIFLQGESKSPSHLNYEPGFDYIYQWTGKLFKHKPPVVFGFEYVSFGCPFISIIDKSDEDIYINCDNRH